MYLCYSYWVKEILLLRHFEIFTPSKSEVENDIAIRWVSRKVNVYFHMSESKDHIKMEAFFMFSHNACIYTKTFRVHFQSMFCSVVKPNVAVKAPLPPGSARAAAVVRDWCSASRGPDSCAAKSHVTGCSREARSHVTTSSAVIGSSCSLAVEWRWSALSGAAAAA